MTCIQFARLLDAILSGDVRQTTVRHGESGDHPAHCATCGRRWRRALQLLKGESAADMNAANTAVRQARERLRAVLAAEGRPVVRFDSLRTPVGRVFVGVSDRGVCDVAFGETSEKAYRARLARWAPEVVRDHGAVETALSELDAYFSGGRLQFSVMVDLRSMTEFTGRVLRATRRIPFGRVLSYGDIARRMGESRASRAVGGALGRNPVPIIVPCHRVIARGGRLGGFTGGLATKRALLRIEGHTLTGGATHVSGT